MKPPMCGASPKPSIPGDNFDVVQNLKRKILRKGKTETVQTSTIEQHPPTMRLDIQAIDDKRLTSLSRTHPPTMYAI